MSSAAQAPAVDPPQGEAAAAITWCKPSGRRQSAVWKYFLVDDSHKPQKAKCTFKTSEAAPECGDILSQKNQTTTNLINHLKTLHKLVLKDDAEEKAQPKKSDIRALLGAPQAGSSHSRRLHALARFIALDMRPVAIVEGEGFLALMKVCGMSVGTPLDRAFCRSCSQNGLCRGARPSPTICRHWVHL
jgi:hypothetical protein